VLHCGGAAVLLATTILYIATACCIVQDGQKE